MGSPAGRPAAATGTLSRKFCEVQELTENESQQAFIPLIDFDTPKPDPLTVYESDATPTGLLDADGRPIYRARQKIGFI